MQKESKLKALTLQQKLDRVHSYYVFTKMERERRIFVSQIDTMIGNLNQVFCKHLFVRILLKKIFNVKGISMSTDHEVREIIGETEKALEKGNEALKGIATSLGPRINELTSKVNESVVKDAMEVSSHFRKTRSQIYEKRKLLKISSIAKVVGFDEKTVNKLETLVLSIETRLKQKVTKDDIIWLQSSSPRIKSLLSKLAARSSVELLQQKLKLKRDEAEAIRRLIAGESLALNSLDMQSINKLKRIFGGAVQVSLKKEST